MRAVKPPNDGQRHILNRFSFGINRRLIREMRSDGGARAWFEHQLRPGRIADREATEMASWFPVLSKTPGQQWRAAQSGEATVYDMGIEFANWTMLRRIYSNRQVHEQMVSFWSDLLHVPLSDNKSWPLRIAYDGVIRRHALGRFDNLLVATETHPAMGAYLDNAASTRTRLNENLGRELLELHTIGIEGKYSEAEVVDSARILTGYRVDLMKTWRHYYSPEDHYVGPVQVLGFTSGNQNEDGRAVTEAYLRYLAHHPLTARRLARRLCTRFVSDQPSAALVRAVADTYLASGTSIKAMLRTLVKHPDFRSARNAKVRTPPEDVAATFRLLRIGVTGRSSSDKDLANIVALQSAVVGLRPFGWTRPDGPPDTADAWTSVGRMTTSWSMHYGVAQGWTPATGCIYKSPESWIPPLPTTVNRVIQHVSRRLLHHRVDRPTAAAIATRLGIPLRTEVTRERMDDWRIALILAALLDGPGHMLH